MAGFLGRCFLLLACIHSVHTAETESDNGKVCLLPLGETDVDQNLVDTLSECTEWKGDGPEMSISERANVNPFSRRREQSLNLAESVTQEMFDKMVGKVEIIRNIDGIRLYENYNLTSMLFPKLRTLEVASMKLNYAPNVVTISIPHLTLPTRRRDKPTLYTYGMNSLSEESISHLRKKFRQEDESEQDIKLPGECEFRHPVSDVSLLSNCHKFTILRIAENTVGIVNTSIQWSRRGVDIQGTRLHDLSFLQLLPLNTPDTHCAITGNKLCKYNHAELSEMMGKAYTDCDIHGNEGGHCDDYIDIECAPGVFARKRFGCQIKFEQQTSEGTGRRDETECAEPKVIALTSEAPWNTCQANGNVTLCYCNAPNCIAGEEYGGLVDFLKNISWVLYAENDSLSCAFNHYNLPVPRTSTMATSTKPPPIQMIDEATTSSHLINSTATNPLHQTIYGTNTPSSGNTSTSTSFHQATTDAKNSFFSGWHIGSIVFALVLVAVIVVLGVSLIKGGGGNKEPAKEQQDIPTAIKIEKPAENKDTATKSKKGDQRGSDTDNITNTNTQDSNDTTTGESTTTTTGGDSTGPEEQVRVSVRALKGY